MNFFDRITRSIFGTTSNSKQVEVKNLNVPSKYLERGVAVDVFLPPNYGRDKRQHFPTIFFNDGQDMPALGMYDTLERLFTEGSLAPCLVVAVHCSADRMNEYGTARQSDYKNRGNRAREYSDFFIHELVPLVRSEFKCRAEPQATTFAGFSLGALSALDISWANPEIFGKVGVFSGSLWWRSREFTEADPDGGRIMHDIVQSSDVREGMKFWFEVGTRDENCDRNRNGVIDAIDDTVDLINDLAALGYRPHEDIKYVEIQGGEHNQQTWGAVMPEFLTWAVGN